uniref:Ubiquitin-like protease family profile domain-containing protein n=1 Tax=Oryza nivara TaxID=4536 RepID=A0A0E0FW04_ORYNI
MGNPNDIEDLFGDSISSESESSPNDDEFCDNEDSESSYVGISKDELLNSLKRKLSKKKNTDEGTSKIGSDDVKENVHVKPIERSFLDMLDSSIGADLTQDMKNKINDLLIQHFGPDENCIDERAKNLLVDVFVLLSNSKPIVPENTNVNLNKDDKSKFNDDSSTDKIGVVDGIMKKLSKPVILLLNLETGLSNTSPKKAISSIVGFNERISIFLGHEKPSFKIWDSDDDFPNEEKHLKTQIIPKDLSQDFDDNSQSQLKNSTNEDKLAMITLEDTDTEILTQHNEKENLNIEQLQKKDSPDVIFIGEKQCPDNCFDITSKTNVLYNKINTFVVKPDKKLKMSIGSPERILLCNVDKFVGRKVAIDIDGVHCKFYTFGDSFKPSGELSNFVACVFCRYMFRSCHPSKSKKHYFFSSIGLFFPIVKSRHWVVFVIDLKSERFVFLDSLYDEESFYHAELRPKLISNFSLAWNLYVQDHSIDFNRFSVIYPPVPKQNNRLYSLI